MSAVVILGDHHHLGDEMNNILGDGSGGGGGGDGDGGGGGGGGASDGGDDDGAVGLGRPDWDGFVLPGPLTKPRRWMSPSLSRR